MQYPKNELEQKQIKIFFYASIVGRLIYAQTCTMPDISFTIRILSTYQRDFGLHHWKATKSYKYFWETKDYMLPYQRSNDLEVIGFMFRFY